MKPNQIEDIAARFSEFVRPNGDCLDWIGAPMKLWGYGRIKLSGKEVRAHRLSYEIHIGKIPEGLMVCHKCDRPICVNPDHLFLGTGRDNQRDCVNKGRKPDRKGELHPCVKLTKANVMEIRASSLSRPKLAQKFDVSYWTIRAIQVRENWQHI